jgi:cyclopropane fatty-acyl-phospholipid synthase-like methyltransferase
MAYRALMRAFGSTRARQLYVNEYVRVAPGMRVLDLGCGPGDILTAMPDVEYVGVDIHEPYVRAARRRFPRATFVLSSVEDLPVARYTGFDRVLGTGVLHHLNNASAQHLLEVAARALSPGGAFVALDPCWDRGQSMISKALVSRDRGLFVRSAEQYVALARQVFPSVNARVLHDLLRIPYTLCVLRASDQAGCEAEMLAASDADGSGGFQQERPRAR